MTQPLHSVRFASVPARPDPCCAGAQVILNLVGGKSFVDEEEVVDLVDVLDNRPALASTASLNPPAPLPFPSPGSNSASSHQSLSTTFAALTPTSTNHALFPNGTNHSASGQDSSICLTLGRSRWSK